LSTEIIPVVVPTCPGVWKFNVSLLLNEDYLALVRIFWAYWVTRKASFRTPLLWWDLGKSRLKLLSINYSTTLHKKRRAERVSLTSRAAALKVRLDVGHVSVLPDYKRVLNDLSTLDCHQVTALRVQSRVRWAESSSSYFLRTIRKTAADKLITCLVGRQVVWLVRLLHLCVRLRNPKRNNGGFSILFLSNSSFSCLITYSLN
jgi:hypothetical protein